MMPVDLPRRRRVTLERAAADGAMRRAPAPLRPDLEGAPRERVVTKGWAVSSSICSDRESPSAGGGRGFDPPERLASRAARVISSAVADSPGHLRVGWGR